MMCHVSSRAMRCWAGHWVIGLVLGSVMLTVGNNGQAQDRVLIMGTGAQTGIYYPLGNTLCRLLKDDHQERHWDCRVESTPGSVYNLDALRRGDLDVAIVQSDWQYHAYYGSQHFAETGPFRELRTLFSAYTEPFTVVARAASGIGQFADLKGRRVNIGPLGSGQRATFEVLLTVQGGHLSDFTKVLALDPTEQAQALCDAEVDAIIYMVGHPNRSILEATIACDAQLIPLTNDLLEALLQQHPYYVRAQIPGALYRGNPHPTLTFGVKATVVASTRLAADVAAALVKAAFTHLPELRATHPALADLTATAMIREGLVAPLHDGAEQYFRAAGLMEWHRSTVPARTDWPATSENASERRILE